MISCVVVFDGRLVTIKLFITTHTSGCSDSAWNLVRLRSWCWKNHFEAKKKSQKREDWSFVHFSVRWNWITLLSADCFLSQCQKVCDGIKNWFQLIYPNLSRLQYCVLLLCVRLRNILRNWYVTTVLTPPTHVKQSHRILYGLSVMIQKQLFRVFQLFVPEIKHFYQETFGRIRKFYHFVKMI